MLSTDIKSSVEWLAKGQGTQGDIAKKGEEVLTLMLAYYKKLPKVMVPTKKESGSKVMAEKAVKGSSGAGEGGKGAKDLQGTVEMLEQRVKTLEVNHASSSVSLYQSSPVVRIMTNSR